MANPTTYFGWVMPTSTDLVTDLPADFNVFGQGVDTSMQYLLGGTTGQVLSKTSGTNMAFTWVTPTDQTPLTTKGDLFTFSTVDARLAIGTNGQTLVADSAQATGLKWGSPSQIGVYANLTGGTQATVAGTPKIIAFATEQWDTNSFHDNSTNNSRITIPTGYGGYYLLVGNFNCTTSDAAALMIYKNGTAIAAGIESGELTRVVGTGGNTISVNASIIVNATAGDYFELAAKIFTAAKVINNAAFQAVYLGA